MARAVALRPLVVLADEPTARLDAANAAAIGALFADLAPTTGAAFVCATHDPLLIEQADHELRARIELMAIPERDDPGQRRPVRALRRPAGRRPAGARWARGRKREPDGPGHALVGRRNDLARGARRTALRKAGFTRARARLRE